MSVKLLTEHHLESLSLKGRCTGSSESTLVKMPHFFLEITCRGSFLIFCLANLASKRQGLEKLKRILIPIVIKRCEYIFYQNM